jgi:hypothetical protein
VYGKTLAEVWNGTAWMTQSTPDSSGPVESILDAVSCTAANSCEAVGDYSSTNNTAYGETLAEVWNGKTWTIQKTPNPVGADDSTLNGVSCTTANSCEAVGDYYNSSGQVDLAEAWNGTAWTVQSTTSDDDTVFTAVSCIDADNCGAVGEYNSGFGIQAQVWNGTTWTAQSVPTPSGTPHAFLDGVSCPAAAACEAVGNTSSATDLDVTLVVSTADSSVTAPASPARAGSQPGLRLCRLVHVWRVSF